MEDEGRRRITEDLLRSYPLLRWNPKGLSESVDAVQRGADSGWGASEAVKSSGQVNNSDLKDPEAFFGDMEGFRRREMGNKSVFPETTDAEDERFFGAGKVSPGQAWLKHIQDPSQPELGGAFEENQPVPTQAAMDRESEHRGLSPDKPWLRRLPAAGRFAARRTR